MQQLFSMIDLTNAIGITEGRIAYAHRTGKLADASYLIAGKRVYTQDDLRRIAEYFGVIAAKKEARGN